MTEYSVSEIIELLNSQDECTWIEAKKGSAFVNQTFRQICGVDVLKSSLDLRKMRDDELLEAKGKGRATYYIPGKVFLFLNSMSYFETAPVQDQTTLVQDQTAPVPKQITPVPVQTAPVTIDCIRKELPEDLLVEIDHLKRKSNTEEIQHIIFRLCSIRAFRLQEISLLIDRTPKHTLRQYIQPMMNSRIEYIYKDMENHPAQAYVAIR